MKYSFNEISEFVADFLSVDERSLEPSTSMRQLGVDGDNADEFMHEFSKRFNVDISEFPFSDYFDDEASTLLLFAWLYRLIRHTDKTRSKSLYLADLHCAAVKGRWDPPGVAAA